MPRTDLATRWIAAGTESVYAALVDPAVLLEWLPPTGMSAEFERFDLRAGGGYRMVLRYEDADGAPGKSTEDSDIVEARFLEVVSGSRVVQEVEFIADDPALAGTMTMTWSVIAERDGTVVEIRADNVPDGISAEDHALGMTSSLANLATLLEG